MALGTISAMTSSIRYNASLRRYGRDSNKFSKKTVFTYDSTNPLSKSENLRIIEENKITLAKKMLVNRAIGITIVLFYGGILIYIAKLLW